MPDLATRAPQFALEMIQRNGRDVILVKQAIPAGTDPDKPWRGRSVRPERTELTVRMAFVDQRQERTGDTRIPTRERLGYLAALDAGLTGNVPTVGDLVKDATEGDPNNCITYSVAAVRDLQLTNPVVYILTLNRQ